MERPNREEQMTASPAGPTPGTAKVLATYICGEGLRQLVGERVDGKVALSDVPAGDYGRVFLVERHVASMAELDGIVADYCRLACVLGRPPMAADWICQ
jgi:hypothetical protein